MTHRAPTFGPDHPEAIPFDKWVGAGNDFIILDNRSGVYSAHASTLARRLCDRHLSIGADGLILLESSVKAHIRVRFFNPDGTEFNMCMNGTRCVARYAVVHVITHRQLTIETNVGLIEAHVEYDRVTLRMLRTVELALDRHIRLDTIGLRYHYVRVGDPHIVVPVRNIWNINVTYYGRRLRWHAAFVPRGTNVNFVHIVRAGEIDIRTYERGVEAETYSCGSGCVSTALAFHAKGLRWPEYRFHTRAGVDLVVRLAPQGPRLMAIEVEGEARRVCSGQIFPEGWAYAEPRHA